MPLLIYVVIQGYKLAIFSHTHYSLLEIKKVLYVIFYRQYQYTSMERNLSTKKSKCELKYRLIYQRKTTCWPSDEVIRVDYPAHLQKKHPKLS